MVSVRCPNGHDNEFDQPWVYHAGFSDVCFLYNDAGTLTLYWDIYDRTFTEYVERLEDNRHNLALPRVRCHIEAGLAPAPDGGRWRFSNPPRCTVCGAAIEPVPGSDDHFVVYPGSINRCLHGGVGRFEDALLDSARAT